MEKTRMRRSTLRRIVGSSIVVAATVLPAGVAAAADYPNPPGPSVSPNQTSTQVKAATATNPSTLPFTGGDVAGLAVIGAGAAIAGTVLVRRSKRHAQA
jgi:hypothetical protein